jgi:hypothetical protein
VWARRRLDPAEVASQEMRLDLALSVGDEEWDQLCAEHLRSYLWRSDLSTS